jgi:hypothetical protein
MGARGSTQVATVICCLEKQLNSAASATAKMACREIWSRRGIAHCSLCFLSNLKSPTAELGQSAKTDTCRTCTPPVLERFLALLAEKCQSEHEISLQTHVPCRYGQCDHAVSQTDASFPLAERLNGYIWPPLVRV